MPAPVTPRVCALASKVGFMVWHGGGRPMHLMPCGIDVDRQHFDTFDCWCEPVPQVWSNWSQKIWMHEAKDGRGDIGKVDG